MIYISADDYGLCEPLSAHIQQCVDAGALHKVSVFPNMEQVDLHQLVQNKNIRIALHLNLVEGKCMADAKDIDLLADKNGKFKSTFGGLFKLHFLHRKQFEVQVYREIKAQILHWKSILPKGAAFCVDSHQHTHMIPSIFCALLKVLQEENIELTYMRIPTEPLMAYIKKPSLYFTYRAVNVIKQWLLNLLWLFNRKAAKKHQIPTAHFMGILFSGEMDEQRVLKVLPEYLKIAEKTGKDIEVLFHPGYLDEGEWNFKDTNVVFEKFYLSEKRKTEFESVMKIQERSVL